MIDKTMPLVPRWKYLYSSQKIHQDSFDTLLFWQQNR